MWFFWRQVKGGPSSHQEVSPPNDDRWASYAPVSSHQNSIQFSDAIDQPSQLICQLQLSQCSNVFRISNMLFFSLRYYGTECLPVCSIPCMMRGCTLYNVLKISIMEAWKILQRWSRKDTSGIFALASPSSSFIWSPSWKKQMSLYLHFRSSPWSSTQSMLYF